LYIITRILTLGLTLPLAPNYQKAKMLFILLLKGWKFVLEKVVGLLEHIIKYCDAQPQLYFGNQKDDGMEEERLENIMPNHGKEVEKW
jgi:hypothetical protein